MSEMKILLISKSSGTGGAAIASTRLMKALREKGVDAAMLVQEGENEKEGIYSTTKGKIKAGINLVRFIIERLAFLRHESSKNIRFLFSLANTGENITQNSYFREADIIHLHWINAGFLSLSTLEAILDSGKPLVWTFHDMWAFTGGCHYALDCTRYEQECGACHYLKRPGIKDLSWQIYKKKEKMFRSGKMIIVTPSQWLNNCVRASSLLKDMEVHTIHNPVDASLFQPSDRVEACRNLGLDTGKKYILFGAATMKNVLKGFSYFLEAVQEIPDQLAEDVEIILFGKTKEDVASMFPLKTRNIAFVKSAKTLVEIYSVAQLFVIPSLQDNLPNTIIESMLCGTPVVGFDTGGIPEMIDHQVNGYLARYKSSSDLARGIGWVLSSDNYDELSNITRASALKKFPADQSVDKHVELYRDLYEKSAK